MGTTVLGKRKILVPVEFSVQCHDCGQASDVRLVHSGFNGSAWAYCDTCGMLCLADIYWAGEIDDASRPGMPVSPTVQARLPPCACGGAFGGVCAPRCPKCRTAFLLSDFPPIFSSGYRSLWRRIPALTSWREYDSYYTFVVEGRRFEHPPTRAVQATAPLSGPASATTDV